MTSTAHLWKPIYQDSHNKLTMHKALLGWLPSSVQDRIGMLRRYHFWGQRGDGNSIVSIVDGSTWHGGLTDRWKGIVSLYAFAKATGRNFKIHYVFPFDLMDFQVPAQYDWRIKPEELSQNFFSVQMLRLTGDPTINRMLRVSKNKQIHAYANRDWIEEINQTYGTHFTWSGLFNELFRPSPLVQKVLEEYTFQTRDPYIAIAFRMQNLLGDFPEYAYQAADDKRQQQIIEACLRCIQNLHAKHHMHILVTSDSNKMTYAALSYPYVFTNHGKAVHADTIGEENVYLKSFVDFYLLSGAQKVYAPYTQEMYSSDFPKYAALTRGADFERIFI